MAMGHGLGRMLLVKRSAAGYGSGATSFTPSCGTPLAGRHER